MPTEEQQAWLGRVLGVTGAPAAAVPSGPRAKMLPIWTAAKDEVDAGIGQLQRSLLDTEDEDLQQIAEYGLYGATTGQGVRLMAALRDADSNIEPGPRPGVLRAVQSYRDFLDGSPVVDLVENNPFGVQVPLRRTLGKALDEVERIASA